MTREEMVNFLDEHCDRSKGCTGCCLDEFSDRYNDGTDCDFSFWPINKLSIACDIVQSHLNEDATGKTDMVNHPLHYTQGGIECIDALKAATVGKRGIEAVCVANVIKYLWRYEEKNGIEDIRKAKWYIERLLKELEESQQS